MPEWSKAAHACPDRQIYPTHVVVGNNQVPDLQASCVKEVVCEASITLGPGEGSVICFALLVAEMYRRTGALEIKRIF